MCPAARLRALGRASQNDAGQYRTLQGSTEIQSGTERYRALCKQIYPRLVGACDKRVILNGIIFVVGKQQLALAQVKTCGSLERLAPIIKAADDEQSRAAIEILRRNGTPCLIHQAKYSMFVRWVEDALLDTLEKEGVGLIAFSPLAQGMLTGRYLHGIPTDSRAAKPSGYLQKNELTPQRLAQIAALNKIASERGQTLAEMALAWLLKDPRVTSVLIGASSVAQLRDNLKALDGPDFTSGELDSIEAILK